MHTDVKPWRNRGETVLIPISKSRKFVLRFRPGEPERLGVTAPLTSRCPLYTPINKKQKQKQKQKQTTKQPNEQITTKHTRTTHNTKKKQRD